MKKILLPFMLIMTLVFTSCTFFQGKVIPAAKKAAAEKITSAIVKAGDCKAVDQVKADVEALLKIESDQSMVVKALGSEDPTGAQAEGIVSEICKSAASLAVPALLQKGVPQKWECGLSDLSGKIVDISQSACGQVPL